METKYPLMDELKIDTHYDHNDLPIRINTVELDLTSDGWLRLHCSWEGIEKNKGYMFKYPKLDMYAINCGVGVTLDFLFPAYEEQFNSKYRQVFRLIREIIADEVLKIWSPFYNSKTSIGKFLGKIIWNIKDFIDPPYLSNKTLTIGIASTDDASYFNWDYQFFQNLKYGVNIYFSPKDWNTGEDKPVVHFEDDDYAKLFVND